ncbi:bifunctional folylpolyglutamate synthase/dihydrofolate synthase [Sphingomonas gilva]|uniref:Dihydrofolate synthase/folylpolyglutamate synthase n=1 Tax=Sphingomonas gilva TaxID=2305907 RepID=A0A396RL32_9SPHN|nr:folylpolyglutamate synthase/dihydrofolate synthase family protein [Sphingomonas gilva]RHW16970.1 bifunctional folylpolyglutamate synthase/dihydrofolate synthase [Sphingomonas gilva]
MPDHARSASPAVQTQLDRLWARSPGADVLGLERITALLARIGNPHRRLPPVFHVAGTNGKGSTCAFLRAALEAAGHRVHVYSSPHLVRFNERIRLSGKLIDDETLAPLLAEVLDAGEDIGASFFEVTTAAAFLAFTRTPADACVIEVGLGGRLDATNVIPDPAVCGIAQLGVDHEAFLGPDPIGIAREKAGIAKPGRPIVISRYSSVVTAAIREVADAAGAPVIDDWHYTTEADRLRYRDDAGTLSTPLPALLGAHQSANLALAVAMLRHQERLPIVDGALATAAEAAIWPARLQRLGAGPLTALLPSAQIYLDGGHNAAAAEAIAGFLTTQGRPARLILGMLANKDALGLLAPIAPYARSLHAVPVPHHDHHDPAALARIAETLGLEASPASDPAEAITAIGKDDQAPLILILGSLYLAGGVLAANGELPE